MGKEIRGILEKLWIDCNNVPDDGTIYDPVGVLIDQATEAIYKLINENYVQKEGGKYGKRKGRK